MVKYTIRIETSSMVQNIAKINTENLVKIGFKRDQKNIKSSESADSCQRLLLNQEAVIQPFSQSTIQKY